MIIDTHCHLVSEKYGDIARVREEALGNGVGHCITQGTCPSEWAPQIELQRRFPDFISNCLAVHPTDCTKTSEEDWEKMVGLCRRHPLAAIGETGLDYYWEPPEGWSEPDYRARQRFWLERHFALAAELGLNISLHTRDGKGTGTACFDDAFAIARQFPRVRPVFHCFIGSRAQAESIFTVLDGMISFTGLITFRRTESVQEVAAWCPEDRLMVETDAPFLSPEPFRGKLNTPARVRLVVDRLAMLRGTSPESVAATTTRNACRFFRLPMSGREGIADC